MSFLKIKHIHTSKLIKIQTDWTYEDLVTHTRSKFPEVGDKEFIFTDEEGTIMDNDVLLDFVESASKPPNCITLYIAAVQHDTTIKNDSPLPTISFVTLANNENIVIEPPGSSSFINCNVDTVNSPITSKEHMHSTTNDHTSLSTISVVSLTNNENVVTDGASASSSFINNNLDTIKSPTAFNKHIGVKEWKQYIMEHGGKEIYENYNLKGMLTPKARRQLVNTCCSQLVNIYGLKVPEFAKIDLAQAIISVFPKLKDPHSLYGYEAFYKNDNGGEGYIAWRLRTIARNSDSDLIRKRKSKKYQTEETNVKNIRTDGQKEDNETEKHNITRQVEDDIEYLKNASPTEDLEIVLHKTRNTFTYRRTLKEEFLLKFPRFLDTPALIEQEFYSVVQVKDKIYFEDLIRSHSDRILNIHKIIFSNKNKCFYDDTDESGNPNFDKTTRAMLALATLLPTLRKKICLENIIIFKHANTPISEIKPKTTQPILLAQGQNKGAISQYNILLDGKILECPRMCTSGKAFEHLFMTHYVFDVKYESTLKCYWEFIQTFYFKIDVDSVMYTPTMTEIRANLLNFE